MRCSHRDRRSTSSPLRTGPGRRLERRQSRNSGTTIPRCGPRFRLRSHPEPFSSGRPRKPFRPLFPEPESANGWQAGRFSLSASGNRIAAEAPYVSQIIQFMYGWDMSPEATYTPVEADTLLAQYTGDAFGTATSTGDTVTYSIPPSLSFPDTLPSKLTANGVGGGIRPVAHRRLGRVRRRPNRRRYSDRRLGRSDHRYRRPDALRGIGPIGDLFPAKRRSGVLPRRGRFLVPA